VTWPDAGSAGPVVLLAVGARAQRSGWSAVTAVELADELATRGESVVLADLSLNSPELHVTLGIDNEEGLTDVFVFGASFQHVMRTVPGKAFRLIPASPFTPDAAEVLTHARWGGLFEELAAKQNTLLIYLPVDVEGAAAFSDRVGHTIILADADEVDEVKAILSDDADVIEVKSPRPLPSPEPEPEIVREPEPDPERVRERVLSRDEEFEKIRIPKDSARDALIADLRARQRAALMAPPPQMTPLPEEGAALVRPMMIARPAGAPPPPVFKLRAMHPTPRKPTRWFTWLLTMLLLVSLVAGVWHYRSAATEWWAKRSGSQAVERSGGQAIGGPAVRRSGGQAVPTSRTIAPSKGEKLPYSVAVASYQVMNLADEQVKTLARSDRDLSFYVAPVAVQGATFFQVMAGPLRDSTTALATRDTLIARKIKIVPTGRDVLTTPLAYLLGEYTTRGEAESKQKDAAQKGVPSYVVEIKAENGSTQYKLYAGAYTGPGDAEFMRPILKAAGLPDNLVERTGSIRS
jgi:hypothetical protein